MRGVISLSFILLLGSVSTSAVDSGASVSSVHDSSLPTPPSYSAILQQGDAVTAYGTPLGAYISTNDQYQERLISSDSFEADSGQPYTRFPDDDLPVMQLDQREPKRLARNRKFYVPLLPVIVIGTKSTPYFVEKKSAAHSVGKAASLNFVGQESAPYLVFKEAAPYFVGQKSVPKFFGKIPAMFVGKNAAPSFAGRRHLADILDNQPGSTMQELSAGPLDPIPSKEDSYLAIPVKWFSSYPQNAKGKWFSSFPQNAKREVLKRNMYPAPFFIGKRYNSILSSGQNSRLQ